MPKNLIYLVFFLTAAATALVVIPRGLYKRYLPYAFIFGGLGDTAVVYLLSRVVRFIRYTGMGAYNLFGLFSIWTPLTWTAAFMLFLHFLPEKKVLLALYVVFFAGFNYVIGWILESLGVFEYIGIYRYFAPITFLLWYGVTAVAYIIREKITLK